MRKINLAEPFLDFTEPLIAKQLNSNLFLKHTIGNTTELFKTEMKEISLELF